MKIRIEGMKRGGKLYDWTQITERQGVYQLHDSPKLVRYVSCIVSGKMKVAIIDVERGQVYKATPTSALLVEAEPLTITFSNENNL